MSDPSSHVSLMESPMRDVFRSHMMAKADARGWRIAIISALVQWYRERKGVPELN